MRILYDSPVKAAESHVSNRINWRMLPFVSLSTVALTMGFFSLYLSLHSLRI
jgi:hypothetical protein